MESTHIGFATSWDRARASDVDQEPENDLVWEVMFVYGRTHPDLRSVRFAGMPHFDPLAVRQVLIDKQAHGDELTRSAGSSEGGSAAARCVLCRLPFGCVYDDPTFGKGIRIERNRRNRYYCNICDAFIRICPGQATLMLPVLVVDVKGSRVVRKQVADLREYSRMLASFHRHVSALIQEHMGFVLNTVGDAVVGVWPSGFIVDRQRETLGWSQENPARVSSRLAIQAAEAIAEDAPRDFDGRRLPYRGALDTTEMIIFSVTTGDPEMADVFEVTPGKHGDVGDPVLSADASDIGIGPTAVDIAGQAVEVASELASDDELPAGVMTITERTDVVADHEETPAEYRPLGSSGTPARLARRSARLAADW